MNKRKLYDSIMESVSKELQNILLFDNSDIFNKEESLYNGSEIIDNYTYKSIIEKLKNAELISEEEFDYYIKINDGISGILLDNLLNGKKISNNIIEKISIYNLKYKVKSKEELKEIIIKYSIINSTASLNWIDTSNITDMSELFYKTDYNGDISEWDTSNVTNMERMFSWSNFNQPIGDWDVSNVTTMESMFHFTESFDQPIENWDVRNVKNMAFMFDNAKSFNQPIGDWNVRKVTDMSYMFCWSNFNQPIGNWNVRNVKNMDCMFNMAKLFNQFIGNWDVRHVKNMDCMFYNAWEFNQDISNWHINKNANVSNMFYRCNINIQYKPKTIKKL